MNDNVTFSLVDFVKNSRSQTVEESTRSSSSESKGAIVLCGEVQIILKQSNKKYLKKIKSKAKKESSSSANTK